MTEREKESDSERQRHSESDGESWWVSDKVIKRVRQREVREERRVERDGERV